MQYSREGVSCLQLNAQIIYCNVVIQHLVHIGSLLLVSCGVPAEFCTGCLPLPLPADPPRSYAGLCEQYRPTAVRQVPVGNALPQALPPSCTYAAETAAEKSGTVLL